MAAPRVISEDVRAIQFGEQADFVTASGAFTTLMAEEADWVTEDEAVERNTQKSEVALGPDSRLMGAEGGSASFKIPMRGGKVAAGGSAARSEFIKLAQYCGFTLTKQAATTATAGTSSTITLTDASSYIVGGFVLVDPTGGDPELRYVYRKVGLVLHVYPNFTTTPQNGDNVYATDVLVPTEGTPSKYLTFDCYMGDGATHRHKTRFIGCAGTWKIPSVKVGQCPYAEFSYQADNYTPTEANLAQELDDYAEAELMLADQLVYGTFSGTYTNIDFESLEFDPGTEMIAKPGQNGGAVSNGRIGWCHRRHNPKFNAAIYWDNEFYSILADKTLQAIAYFNLVDVYHAWGMAFPSVQIYGHTPGSFAGGMISSQLMHEICDPGENDDSDRLPRFSICVTGSGP